MTNYTFKSNSEYILYRSCTGQVAYAPGKNICQNMIARIPLDSEIEYMGIKVIGKNSYDSYRSGEHQFITELNAIAHPR
jgi:hypothetical protein